MWKRLLIVLCIAITISVVAVLLPEPVDAQMGAGPLTPYSKSVLDFYYRSTTGMIDGAYIIDGSISTGKLDFAVVPYEDYTNFYALYLIHTNDPSAHHEKFTNADETDPIFSSWLSTNVTLLQTVRITTADTPYSVLYGDEVVYANTSEGSVTSALIAGVSGKRYRFINTGTNGKTLTVSPNGFENLLGKNTNFMLLDGDVLTVVYEATEGWW